MKAPNSKTRKGATAFAAAIALSLTAAACSSDDSASDCDIGMVQINQTAAFFTQMNEGAEEAAAAAGCELTIANANGDPAKQNSDIENFVTQGVNGLIVVAIDVNGVLPAVQDAMADGIKVIAIDAKLD